MKVGGLRFARTFDPGPQLHDLVILTQSDSHSADQISTCNLLNKNKLALAFEQPDQKERWRSNSNVKERV